MTCLSRGVVVFLIGVLGPTAAHAQPAAGAWFQYSLERRVHSGSGEYAGYTDSLTSSGRYEVTAVDAERATVHATYDWRFSSEERNESGNEDRTVTFGLADRRYREQRTDLDDYDNMNGPELATWFWIPADVQEGAQVQILERLFTVRSRTATVRVGGADRTAIELYAAGDGRPRNDDYGSFQTTFTDHYFFDATTGYFLRGEYEERDDGTYEGRRGAFQLSERIEITDASYAAAVAGATPEPLFEGGEDGGYDGGSSDGGSLFVGFLILAAPFVCVFSFIALVVWLIVRRRGARTLVLGGRSVRVERRKKAAPVPAATPEVTRFFAPFLDHWVRAADAAGDDVAVATVQGTLVGVAIHHQDAQIGTILANDPEVCEALRKELGVMDFFAETRHPALPSVMQAAAAAGQALPSGHAYNVFETYEVLRLERVPDDLSYDAGVVSRMRDEDVPAAAALGQSVYGVPSERWLKAQLAAGDIGFVVKKGGVVVGFGLASEQRGAGRLHTLTVHPDHRGQGLGKELTRARLRALADLGVSAVVAEVATWNVGSLEVLRSVGFEKAGEMVVESAREAAIDRKIVRR